MVVLIHANVLMALTNNGLIELTKRGLIDINIPKWLDIFAYVVSEAISRCAVPSFFFISALLLYRKPFSWSENLRKKFYTILLPYFILDSLVILVTFITQQIPFLRIYYPSTKIITDWSFIQWLNAYTGFLTGAPALTPLWFMRDLFILNILSLVYMKIIDKFPKISFCLFIFLWLTVKIPVYQNSLQSICFWGLGCLFVRKKLSLDIIDKFKTNYIRVLYIVFIMASVLSRNMSINLFIFRACILVGIIFWYKNATILHNKTLKNFFIWLSSFSFSIYLFHGTPQSALHKVLLRKLPTTQISLLMQYIFVPVIIICYCVLLSIFLKKYFPRTYGVITGNRKI